MFIKPWRSVKLSFNSFLVLHTQPSKAYFAPGNQAKALPSPFNSFSKCVKTKENRTAGSPEKEYAVAGIEPRHPGQPF